MRSRDRLIIQTSQRIQMTNGNVTLGLDPQIGDKAHVLYFSDIHPCTVIKRTKKFVWVQMDNYKLKKIQNLK